MRRGHALESEHPVTAVLVVDGRVREAIGDPAALATWRSAAKPFQLEVSFPATGLDVPDRWLAVGASSHWGQDVHIAVVREVLAACGNGPEALFCGADWPSHPGARTAALRATDAPRAIWNNCSGKHAFMAGACRVHGWEADYRPVEHPLQERILARVIDRAGTPVTTVVDGCGVPCFVLPLEGMARAWSALAAETSAGTSVLGRIGRSMADFPVEAGGEGAIDTAMMAAATRPVVAKVGAEGLLDLAIPGERAGIAVKVWTGDASARAVAVSAVLARWYPGLVPPEIFRRYAEVRNVVGRVVGERVAVG